MPEQFLFLLVAAFFAGLVDAMGGGGGLIQVPTLFSSMGQTAPATLFGSNKLAVFGAPVLLLTTMPDM